MLNLWRRGVHTILVDGRRCADASLLELRSGGCVAWAGDSNAARGASGEIPTVTALAHHVVSAVRMSSVVIAFALACEPTTGALVVPPIAQEPEAPPPPQVPPCCAPKPPPARVVGPSIVEHLDGGGLLVGVEYLAALTYAGADPVAVVDAVADAGANFLRVFTVLARRPPEVPAYPGWIVSPWAHEEAWRARLEALLDRAAERGVFVSLCLFDRVDRGYVGGGGSLLEDLEAARTATPPPVNDGGNFSASFHSDRSSEGGSRSADVYGTVGRLDSDVVRAGIEPYAAGTWGPHPIPDGWPEVVAHYLRDLTPEFYPHVIVEVENEPGIAGEGGVGGSGLPGSAVVSELRARGLPTAQTVDYYDLASYPADMVREHHWALRDRWPDYAVARLAVLRESNPDAWLMASTDGAALDRTDGLDPAREAALFRGLGASYAVLVIRPESVGPAAAEAVRGWGSVSGIP